MKGILGLLGALVMTLSSAAWFGFLIALHWLVFTWGWGLVF